MMRQEHLRDLLGRFPRLRLAVVGDFFLDQYLVIDPALAETSLETGRTCHQVVARRCSPGAAGTVVANLAALGAGAIRLVGAIGDDGEGYVLRRGLQALGTCLDDLLLLPEWFTPTYTKPMRRDPAGECELERLDHKNRAPLPAAVEERLIAALRRLAPQVDAVIIADQVSERNCGVITDRVRAVLADLAAAHPTALFFADSRERIGEFRGVVTKPNRAELARALGSPAGEALDSAEAGTLGQQLAARTGQPVIVTLGAEGSLVCSATETCPIPAVPVSGPVDPVGAGDSTTAGIVCARCAGADWPAAAFFGNLVASITVQKLGMTGTASPQELLEQWGRIPERWDLPPCAGLGGVKPG